MDLENVILKITLIKRTSNAKIKLAKCFRNKSNEEKRSEN